MEEIVLRKGREQSLRRRHPWVFSGAVESCGGANRKFDPSRPPARSANAPHLVADIFSSSGEWLARGLHSPASQIRVRVLTFDRNERIDAEFFKRRITAAWDSRKFIWNEKTRNCARWVHGESDDLPGLVIDRYRDIVSVQILTAGMDEFRDEITNAILSVVPDAIIYERSDTASRALEGLPARTGCIVDACRYPDMRTLPQDGIIVQAHGIKWKVDVANGHKTGSYLDQIENRAAVGALAQGRDVLDAFCHDGGFAMHCLVNNAKSVLAIDSSQDALNRAAENFALNALDASRCELCCADVFAELRKCRDRARSFDLIILDPPKFADSKGHVDRACRAYKDINMLAFKLLRPGGLLATFSCSGAVDSDLFQKVVADAALDANRDARDVNNRVQRADFMEVDVADGHAMHGGLRFRHTLEYGVGERFHARVQAAVFDDGANVAVRAVRVCFFRQHVDFDRPNAVFGDTFCLNPPTRDVQLPER
ncbi:MAG: class I SAM-dependent methyltransferase, partial [Kiritimatiellaeota bacterium]|nr:class I SAM-dependent methyltransferase [Kiritimatiellota bacterium]